MTNIPIPEEIALLGVDNDELMCNISDPPISSIELEVERGGYSIGRLIHQQIKKNTKVLSILLSILSASNYGNLRRNTILKIPIFWK